MKVYDIVNQVHKMADFAKTLVIHRPGFRYDPIPVIMVARFTDLNKGGFNHGRNDRNDQAEASQPPYLLRQG